MSRILVQEHMGLVTPGNERLVGGAGPSLQEQQTMGSGDRVWVWSVSSLC